MKAEIIAVGTELLLGQIVNTNAQYLSSWPLWGLTYIIRRWLGITWSVFRTRCACRAAGRISFCCPGAWPDPG